MSTTTRLGATYLGQGQCHFLIWAPAAQTVQLRLIGLSESDRLIPLDYSPGGYHHALVEEVEPGCLYQYRLNDHLDRADPASRCQPQDVHGPSQVVDAVFDWKDQGWGGLALPDYIVYELHVGTFTQQGTFDAVIGQLDDLATLGVTAIELMPIAQFPGNRNWGYDGVFPFAAQASYGGPEGLKRLVNACHQRQLAVVLDVVYNHLGPEGNYLGDFAPYFTDRYKTPWGQALNFDGSHSDDVRRYFIENALYWIDECHIDALRLDAVHAIVDHSAYPFLEELAHTVHQRAAQLNRHVHLIAESSLNDARMIRSPELGGYGLDAQWNDEFHHALHTLLTDEKDGYYKDFGSIHHLAKSLTDGYVYAGQYSPFRQRRHGNSSRSLPSHQFVICTQNHDQIGNRLRGERLSELISFEGLKLAAGIMLLSPCIPMLFMGEEYGEPAPFPYFISHTDPDLVDAVRQGRREEFAAFDWDSEPPDPQSETVFQSAKVHRDLRRRGHYAVLHNFYQALISLRRSVPALSRLDKECLEVCAFEAQQILCMRRWNRGDEALSIFNFSPEPATIPLPWTTERWHKILDSSDKRWNGAGSEVPTQFEGPLSYHLVLPPLAVVLFTRSPEEEREWSYR